MITSSRYIRPTTNFELPNAISRANLGLQQEGHFHPVAVSLTPWKLQHDQWKMGFVTARALGKLFSNMALTTKWLASKINELPNSTLAKKLIQHMPSERENRARLININRHDLVLDEQANWKLIESNSIAAGMGPFSEALQEVLSDTQTADTYFPPNNAAERQAKAIADCAMDIARSEQTNVVFVIEADEDNVFDQGKLAEALTALGVRVIWKTLSELRTQLTDENSTAVLTQGSEVLTVHGIYFRTGYNLKDYGDNDNEQQKNLAFRGRLERLDLALCPTISHQLATNKWIQAQLSGLSIDQFINEFSLTTQEAILAQLSLKVPYAKTTERKSIEAHLKTGEWIWKLQGEGGGNVKTTTEEASDDELIGSVLMKRIKPMPRPTPVEKYANEETIEIQDTVSELGFFTVGDSQDYGGYLLRTKPCSELETGVHKGFGMIDTVQITQRC